MYFHVLKKIKISHCLLHNDFCLFFLFKNFYEVYDEYINKHMKLGTK